MQSNSVTSLVHSWPLTRFMLNHKYLYFYMELSLKISVMISEFAIERILLDRHDTSCAWSWLHHLLFCITEKRVAYRSAIICMLTVSNSWCDSNQKYNVFKFSCNPDWSIDHRLTMQYASFVIKFVRWSVLTVAAPSVNICNLCFGRRVYRSLPSARRG